MWKTHLNYLKEFFSHDVWLLDAFGRAVSSKHYLFVPCSLDFPESKRLALTIPDEFLTECQIAHCITEDWENFDLESLHVIWLRGRLARIFGVQMPFAQEHCDVFQMSFVAINPSVTPFEIFPFAIIGGGIGDYGGCELEFKLTFHKSLDRASSKLLASDFVQLLTDACDVNEFCDYMSDGTTVYRISLTTNNASITTLSGLTTLDEHQDFEEVVDEHLGFGYFDDRECADCNGTGYEYIKYPISQSCESCNGNGRVHW